MRAGLKKNKKQKKSENWVKVLGFSCHKNNSISKQWEEVMNIKLNYVSMQNGTMFYLLDLVDHSWTMGKPRQGRVKG